MEFVTCNLCGSAESEFVYRMPDMHYFNNEWFDVVECGGCGLGFVNPRPSRGEIAKYYPSAFFDTFDHDKGDHDRRYAVEAGYLDAHGGEAEDRFLLDVGCANGDFPLFLKDRGWRVEGVEVAPNARPITDFHVYTTEFPSIPVDEPKYDAVTAWAVMEHVHDPMAYFRKASQIIKPGGLFVFLVTNFKSISSAGLFREDVPRHLYFYTEQTVKRYLELNDFTLIKADYGDSVYEMIPLNWLRHYLYKYLLGRSLSWGDLPETRLEYFERSGLGHNIVSTLRYILSHPLTMLDRLLVPLYERWQILRRSYGIVVYVARR